MQTAFSLSIVIPTYQRGRTLLKTIAQLLQQDVSPSAIIIVDQTAYAEADPIFAQLSSLHVERKICLIQLATPSIPAAMNAGLMQCETDYVLFLDDDIEVGTDFVQRHLEGLVQAATDQGSPCPGQVGQVLQPGQLSMSRPVQLANENPQYGLHRDLGFPFNSDSPAWIGNCMAGNLCVHRISALDSGGFDEQFSGAAFRFETEFARRLIRSSNMDIHYWPAAKINHLQLPSGGTRAHANHLRSPSAVHTFGDYYYAARQGAGLERMGYWARRFCYSVISRFYLRNPWIIPRRLLAEFRGFLLAIRAARQPAKLIQSRELGQHGAPLRVAVLMSHPTQHFAPVYRALAQHADIQLKVFFLANNGIEEVVDPGFNQAVKWDIPLLDGYDYEFLEPTQTIREFGFASLDHAAVVPAINDYQPAVIWLHGYAQRANWRLWLSAGDARIVYTSDSNLADHRGLPRRILKYALVKTFLRGCDHFISIGDANSKYLTHYGVKDSNIVRSPFPIDMSYWQAAAENQSDESRAILRQELGIDSAACVFLFAGKLLPHKRPGDLLQALATPNCAHAVALIVGDGPERLKLERQAKSLGLLSRVRFVGFKNQSELPQYFALSDCLVFPSEVEPYGAIAAEVLPFGLPIIAADTIGAVGSVIKPNENGLVFPANNVEALADHMHRLLSDADLRDRLGDASRKLAPSQDAQYMASTIAKLCQEFQ